MESLEREFARRTQAESNRQRFESPVIKTLADIKRVLTQLEPHSRLNMKFDDVILSTNMTGTDSDNRSQTFHVSAATKTSSPRDMLMEGLKIAKQREEAAIEIANKEMSIEVNGKPMKSPPVISESGVISIDPVISRMLGGYRRGHHVQWDLIDGFTYRYDIFEHRLSRFQSEPGE